MKVTAKSSNQKSTPMTKSSYRVQKRKRHIVLTLFSLHTPWFFKPRSDSVSCFNHNVMCCSMWIRLYWNVRT